MKKFFLTLLLSLTIVGASGKITPEETARAAASGHKLYKQGRLSDAILSFSEVAESVRRGDEKPSHCRDLYIAGNACLESNRFVEALEFYTLALEIARGHNLSEDIAGISANIGVIYSIFHDYEKSLRYFHLAFGELQKHPDENIMPIVLANLVISYSKSGQPAEARKYLKLQAQHPLPDKAVHQYHIYYNQGVIAAADGNPGGNLYYQQKALDVIEANGLPDLMRADILEEMGHAYAGLGERDKALSCYKEMLRISEAGGFLFQINEASRRIADLFREENQTDSAAFYLHRQAELADTIFNMQHFNAAKDKLDSYEDFLVSSRIESLTQSNRVLGWILGGVVVVLLLGGGWIASVTHLNRNLKQARMVLVHKNEELMASLGMDGKGHPETCPEKEDGENTTDAGESDKFEISPEIREIIRKRISSIMADTDVITDSEFSINQLAEMVKTNTKYVSTVINSTYGMTFKALLSERRIIEASRRLSDEDNYGHLTVTAIGASVGYNSPTGFADAFRRVNGMTPGKYRKLSAEKSEG